MASPLSLRCGCLWLALSAALLVIGLVLALIARGHLPLSSLPVTVLLLGLSGAAFGVMFTLRLTAPATHRRRDRALTAVLTDVTAGKYRAAPDEV